MVVLLICIGYFDSVIKKKKKTGKKSKYMVSHPELGSDPPIGSDRESGRDMSTLVSFSLILVLG